MEPLSLGRECCKSLELPAGTPSPEGSWTPGKLWPSSGGGRRRGSSRCGLGGAGLCGLLPGSSRWAASVRGAGGTSPATESHATVCRSLPTALEASGGLQAAGTLAATLPLPPGWWANDRGVPDVRLEHGYPDPVPDSVHSPASTIPTIPDIGRTLSPLPALSPVPAARQDASDWELVDRFAGPAVESHSGRQVTIENIGPREPLSSLIDEFRYNAMFGEKIRHLQGLGYDGWRRVRGDGNCYYRAVGVGLLEYAANRGCDRWAAAFEEQLQAFSFEGAAKQEAHNELRSFWHCLREARAGGKGRAREAESRMRATLNELNCGVDLALIRALRLLTAQFLKENRDNGEIANGLPPEILCESLGFGGVDGFCDQVVLPLGVEAQDLVQIALPQALGIWVRIAFLERGGQAEVPLTEFGAPVVDEGTAAAGDARSQPCIHVQLRPGHYDLLYFGGVPAQNDEEQQLADQEIHTF
uniref:ubiquitinyl hydrolase 1 n=1 Tax=Pyrodinium bahamense TaxID=73915 RepID=A0A7S0AKS8_9DINO